jgi:hypothetical protein
VELTDGTDTDDQIDQVDRLSSLRIYHSRSNSKQRSINRLERPDPQPPLFFPEHPFLQPVSRWAVPDTNLPTL